MPDQENKGEAPSEGSEDRKVSNFEDTKKFEELMAVLRPHVNFSVPDQLNEGKNILLRVEFDRLNDFKPDQLAQEAPRLRDLFEMRDRLKELKDHLNAHDAAEVDQVLNDLLEELQKREKGNP